MKSVHLAVDIGAESGRIFSCWQEGGRLQIQQVARFPNAPVQESDGLKWNIPQLVNAVRAGIGEVQDRVLSVGIDTWAVDYGLLDAQGNLIDLPFHYRDKRNIASMQSVVNKVSPSTIYQKTGIQFLPFNTIYQLADDVQSGRLAKAKEFAMIPDLIAGQVQGLSPRVCERANASTTQMVNATTGNWDEELLDLVGIPRAILPRITEPGSIERSASEDGMKWVSVCSHDTASAALVLGGGGGESAWISSGTWSIVGVDVDQPDLSLDAMEGGLTNERGYDGFRLSKNVMGLWIVQQLMKEWGEHLTAEEWVRRAGTAAATGGYFDPDDARLLAPSCMESAVRSCLASEVNPLGEDRAGILRIVLENLAFKYRFVLETLALRTGRTFQSIRIGGGGCQNQLLNQLTANVCQLPVIAGPVEASVIGNCMVQMVALAELDSIAEARQLVAQSFEQEVFDPQQDELSERYREWKSLFGKQKQLEKW